MAATAASPELQAKGGAARAHVQARSAPSPPRDLPQNVLAPYSFHTTQYSLLTTHYSLLTAHCSLLTTHYSPLTTHHSLLQASFSLEAFGRQLETYLLKALGGRARTD